MTSISIVGYGFVGSAVKAVFPTKNVFLADPKLGTSIEDIPFDTDFIFICLPTPEKDDGSANIDLVVSSVNYLLESTSSQIIIKSTVPPSILKNFSNLALNRLCFNPEFLTERNAVNDMINADNIVLGGFGRACKLVRKLYKEHSICTARKFTIVSAEEACWIKYITNTMLAAKVALLNEYYQEFDNKEAWISVVKVLQMDERLGTSHWQVPGTDGKLGFGGACFPKDLNSILPEAKNLSILKKVAESNNKLRAQYSLDDRETQQNINFKKGN